MVMDVITCELQKSVPWMLLYANDVLLASENKEDLEQQVQGWSDCLAMFGLHLNTKKTEYMMTDHSEFGIIYVDGATLPHTETSIAWLNNCG